MALQAAELRAALLTAEQAAALDVPGQVDAAVLVALFERDAAAHAVFTRRRHDLRRHAGEISFPGGRQDPVDEDLRATALREAHEEIGLAPGDVRLVGALAPTGTLVTGFAIYPFVGLIEPPARWRPSPLEVAEVLELPLAELARARRPHRLTRRGITFTTDAYELDGRLVWGATARILDDLLARLRVDGRALT